MDLLNGHSGRVNAVQWVHRHDCGESAEGGGWMEPSDRLLFCGEVCLVLDSWQTFIVCTGSIAVVTGTIKSRYNDTNII